MKHSGLLLALVAVLAAGCGRQPSRLPETPSEPGPGAGRPLSALGYAAQRQEGKAAGPMPLAAPAAPAPSPVPRLPAGLKLIWTAALQIEVPDFRAAVEEAGRDVAALGGYMSDRQSTLDGAGRERGQVILRVPSEKFDGAMSALKRLGWVKSEGVQTQDVTRAYADLETRLAVKREAAARLREILRSQTGKVSEVLEVEREIARVVGDIEQAEGERRYLEHQVSLSTITLSLHEPDALVNPGFLDPVVAALRQSLRILGESLGSLIELLSGLLPWFAALYLAFRVALWRLRRRG